MKPWFTVINQHPVIDDRDFKRFLRYPPAREWDAPLAENAAWARAWYAEHGRPWCCVLEASAAGRELVSTKVEFGEMAAVIVASAGPEAEAEAAVRWAADEPDRYYFLECYAAAVVEALVGEARDRLGATTHYCPGYTNWPISDNLDLLRAVEGVVTLPGPLDVLSSGMLVPKKSQIAVCAPKVVPVGAEEGG